MVKEQRKVVHWLHVLLFLFVKHELIKIINCCCKVQVVEIVVVTVLTHCFFLSCWSLRKQTSRRGLLRLHQSQCFLLLKRLPDFLITRFVFLFFQPPQIYSSMAVQAWGEFKQISLRSDLETSYRLGQRHPLESIKWRQAFSHMLSGTGWQTYGFKSLLPLLRPSLKRIIAGAFFFCGVVEDTRPISRVCCSLSVVSCVVPKQQWSALRPSFRQSVLPDSPRKQSLLPTHWYRENFPGNY